VQAKNVAGELFKLSDHLMFGLTDSQDAEFTYADAAAARDGIKFGATSMGLGQDIYTDEVKMLAGETDYAAIVIYMPETVGNEANYRPTEGYVSPPQVELSLNIAARQATQESDAFNDQYDAEATYDAQSSNGQLLKNLNEINALPQYAMATLQLLGDEGYEGETLTIKAGNNITIDLAGHSLDIINNAAGEGADAIVVEEGATLNLVNSGSEGTLDIKAADGKEAITVNGGTLNIETAVNLPGDENSIVAKAADGKQAVVNIKDGANLTSAGTQNNVISLQENAVGNMTGGVIKGTYSTNDAAFACVTGISLDADSAVFNMSGGEIWVLGNHGASGISTTMLPNTDACATINVTGGKIYVQSEACSGYMAGIEAGSGSTVNISNVAIDVNVKGNPRGASAVYLTKSVHANIGEGVKISVQETGNQNNWGVATWNDDFDLGKRFEDRTGKIMVGNTEYTAENYSTIFDGIVTYQ